MGSQRRRSKDGPQILRLARFDIIRVRCVPSFGRKRQNHLRRYDRRQMEPRRPFDPLRPAPIEPLPSPMTRPTEYLPRNDETLRILKEILDRLTSIESRLKTVEEHLKARH